MFILATIFSFLFGAAWGSFLNVLTLRLPEGQSLGGRSHCPNCHRQLTWWELLPLFSYLFLLGKCSSCGKKISPRYFIIEFIVASLFTLLWWQLRPANPATFLLLAKDWFLALVLVTVFVIDFEQFLILDAVIIPAAIVVVIFNLSLDLANHSLLLSLHSQLLSGLLAAVLAALPFWLIWLFSKGHWMGFGDVKLAVFLGLALGWPLVLVALMLGIIIGGVCGAILLFFTEKTLKAKLPFGTFLAIGTIIAMFFGERLLSWYLALLGF